MDYGFGTEGYYQKMLQLQDRLRKSEEDRLKLEEKFNEMMQITRDAEHDRLRLMRHRYHKFLEEDKIRQERNENILRALDKIESRAKMLAAKTSRFKAFRKQYESYIKRIYQANTEQQLLFQNTSPTQPDRNYTHSNVRKKLFSDMPAKDESVEDKLAMLEQYLRDNFDNFPRDRQTKSQNSDCNDNRIFEEENGDDPSIFEYPQRNTFYNNNNFGRQQYFDRPDSDSKETQEVSDDYNIYLTRQFNSKPIPEQNKYLSDQNHKTNAVLPTKSEILGNTIEKELERLKNKEPIKPILLQKENSIEKKPQISFQKENSFEKKQQIRLQKENSFERKQQIPFEKENSFEIKQPEQVIQDYKDLVSKSEEKFGLRDESPVRKNVQENKESINMPNIFDNKTKTLNIDELKNIASTKENIDKTAAADEIINSDIIAHDNADSESDSSVIKNYKNMIKSLHEELPSTENNNINENVDIKPSGSHIIQENSISEPSRQEDISESTEPPSNISFNLSSHNSDKPLPVNQTKTEQNTHQEHVEENDDNSVNESTIKEQLHVNQEKKQNKLPNELKSSTSNQILENTNNQNVNQTPDLNHQNYQPQEEILGEQVHQKYSDQENNQIQEHVYDEQNYPLDGTQKQEGFDTTQQESNELSQKNITDQQPIYQEGYDILQQNVSDPNYQEDYDASQQNISEHQPEYQESYNVSQQNIPNQQPEYQEGYDISQPNITNQQPEYQENYDVSQQPEYQEGYDVSQQNITNQQPEYQENYDVSQQNIPNQQPEYQEGYDVSQQNITNQQPEYQENYDVSQQNIPNQQPEYQEGYDVSQQNIPNQQPEYQENYDVSQQNIPNQQPEYQEGYDVSQQNIPNQQPEYQEGYNVSQQNIPNQQPEYQEGYDISQQNISDPNYQEGYDQQYYSQQQNEPGQEGYDNQQYTEGQPTYPEGYEQQYPQEQYTEEQQQQQQPYDQSQYQEYPEQEYQPQEYTDQQYPQGGQVSDSVYRSQEEYLEGEQNIDKQYESEQNQEYQQQEYQDSQDNIGQEQPQVQSEEFRKDEQQESNIVSESTENSSSKNDFVDNKPLVEKKLPNLADMLDTDTESIKQDTKVSNDSDFDFSKS